MHLELSGHCSCSADAALITICFHFCALEGASRCYACSSAVASAISLLMLKHSAYLGSRPRLGRGVPDANLPTLGEQMCSRGMLFDEHVKFLTDIDEEICISGTLVMGLQLKNR